MSPDGQNIVTGAGNHQYEMSLHSVYIYDDDANCLIGDETLRFWNVFPGPKNKTGFRVGPSILLPSGAEIRWINAMMVVLSRNGCVACFDDNNQDIDDDDDHDIDDDSDDDDDDQDIDDDDNHDSDDDSDDD